MFLRNSEKTTHVALPNHVASVQEEILFRCCIATPALFIVPTDVTERLCVVSAYCVDTILLYFNGFVDKATAKTNEIIYSTLCIAPYFIYVSVSEKYQLLLKPMKETTNLHILVAKG